MAVHQILTLVSCCNDLTLQFNYEQPDSFYYDGSTYYYNGKCFTAFITNEYQFPIPILDPQPTPGGSAFGTNDYLENVAYFLEGSDCNDPLCPDCDEPEADCYYIENCFDSTLNFIAIISNPGSIQLGYSYSFDLSNVDNLPADYNNCWSIESSADCNDLTPTIEITTSYESCESCAAVEVPPCFKLIDCNTEEELIYSGDLLEQYINKVIQVDIDGIIRCFTVEITTCTEESLESLFENIVLDCFTECEKCLPECTCTRAKNLAGEPRKLSYIDCNGDQKETDEVIGANKLSKKYCVQYWTSQDIEVINFGDCVDNSCPEIPLPKRVVTPGYNTPICTPAQYERIVCIYAEIKYKEVLSKRYGIEDCCDDESLTNDIKHELIHLQMLEDPEYVCVKDPKACPTKCGYISMNIVHECSPEIE